MEDTELLQTAIDKYYSVDEQIKELEKIKKECKETIMSNCKVGEKYSGLTMELTVKPGYERFKCYSDEEAVVKLIKEANLVHECISLDRTKINQFIKSKALPEEITKLEIKEETAPRFVFEILNPWV